MTSDFSSTFDAKSCIKLIGQDMTRAAAEKVYEQSGLGPENVQVIELHDCFSTNELVTYEGLGLCPEGKGGELIESGAVTYGGKWVVNPSGGLISKGHPLGRPGSPSVPSSTGSSAGWRTSGRCRARRWRCSTTWASAARPSSRCTARATSADETRTARSSRPRRWETSRSFSGSG